MCTHWVQFSEPKWQEFNFDHLSSIFWTQIVGGSYMESSDLQTAQNIWTVVCANIETQNRQTDKQMERKKGMNEGNKQTNKQTSVQVISSCSSHILGA